MSSAATSSKEIYRDFRFLLHHRHLLRRPAFRIGSDRRIPGRIIFGRWNGQHKCADGDELAACFQWPRSAFSNLAPDVGAGARLFLTIFQQHSKCSREQVESRWMDAIAELLSNERAAGLSRKSARQLRFCDLGAIAVGDALIGKSMWAIKHVAVASRVRDRTLSPPN